MTILGTAFIPDDNCPCEEATVRYLELHPGQWEAVIVSCPKNCDQPQMTQEPDVYSNFGVESETQ